MKINNKNFVSIAESNQNFSKVAQIADKNGYVVIMENNTPKYILVEFALAEKDQLADDEELLEVSQRLIEQNRNAYDELAKNN